MNMRSWKNALHAIIPFAIALLPAIALAQNCMTSGGGGFVPLACTETGSKLAGLYSSNSLSGYVNALFKFALSAGGIIAVIKIAQAGYYYMGSDLWTKKEDAKKILGDVTFGLILLLAIYLILYQINPNILNLDAFQTDMHS